MNLDLYLKNPCKNAPLPFWKMNSITLSKNIKVFHHNDFDGSNHKSVERFFRMSHDLKKIEKNDANIKTIDISDWNNLIKMINECYKDQSIAIHEESLKEYVNRKVYHSQLWVCIYLDDIMIASAIAEFDSQAKEGIIEWVQVSPKFRHLGYGSMLVNELLTRLKSLNADFVTVSGNYDNIHRPIDLYKRCGFTGDNIWYICKD